jgi:hypothetical protein
MATVQQLLLHHFMWKCRLGLSVYETMGGPTWKLFCTLIVIKGTDKWSRHSELVQWSARLSDSMPFWPELRKTWTLKLTTTTVGDMQQHYLSVLLCDLWVAPTLIVPEYVLLWCQQASFLTFPWLSNHSVTSSIKAQISAPSKELSENARCLKVTFYILMFYDFNIPLGFRSE